MQGSKYANSGPTTLTENVFNTFFDTFMTCQELFENPILDVYASGGPMKSPYLISKESYLLTLNQPVPS